MTITLYSMNGTELYTTDTASSVKGAIMEAVSNEVDLTDLACEGQALSGMNTNTGHLTGANFSGCAMAFSALTNTDFTNAIFCGASLFYADFTGSTLTGADFNGACVFNVTWPEGYTP